MLLSYERLVKLVEQGVINASIENINGASIDITLDKKIRVEKLSHGVVDLAAKESINTVEVEMDEHGFLLHVNEFILASSKEVFNLPDNIAAEYKLKSTLARNGLEHANAGFADPHWHGSKLTLELKNVTQYHTLLLREGMKIGQILFFEVDPVPAEHGYAVKGQYNNQTGVTPSKGLR